MRKLRRLFGFVAALGLPLTLGACVGVTDLGHADGSVGGSSACTGADCTSTGGSGASTGGSGASTGGSFSSTGGSISSTGGSITSTGGSSVAGVCPAGFANCNAISADGCEVNLVSDNSNCGTCGNICGSGRTCSQGICAQPNPVCSGTFANCDGNAANGCETNIATSVNNCGSCGTQCSMANATPACINSTCAIGMCNAGHGNCDGNTMNGCEIDLRTDNANCGSCANSCGSNMLCVNAQCVVPE